MSLGSRVRMGGWICAISLPERWYGCRNVGFGPNFTIFCYQIDLGSNHTHQSKINGGENLPLKDLVRGPVCWAKMVHFWKPRKYDFWPSSECWEPFSMLPRHTLSSFYGLECWGWAVVAATAEVNSNPCNIYTGLKHLFQWDQLIVCQTHSKSAGVLI